MSRLAVSLVLLVLSLACAKGPPGPNARAPGTDSHSPSADVWPGARGATAEEGALSLPADDARSSSEPAAPSYAERGRAPSSEQRRRERPGLGTQWGDTRTSRVHEEPFERRSPHRPWASATLHYDDAEGVQAMLRGAALGSYALSDVSVARGAVSVRVLDAWGSPLPAYGVGSRQYVTGRHGDRYVIELANHTSQRFEAVVSVDGLDVIDGRPAALGKRGYVLAPYARLAIEGFRRSLHEVAEFRFGSVADSYAARTGSARNVGVIGVAVFDERGAPSVYREHEADRRHRADPFPGRFAAPPD